MDQTILLPKKFSADFISQIFYPEEWKKGWLRSINSGRCYDWAYYAYCLWPNVKLWTTEHHAWVQVGKKFFDSESGNGIQDHCKLNCNSVWPGEETPPTIMSSEDFQKFWNKNGGGRKYHWDIMQQEIREKGLHPIRN
jgi:hypothetical protein